MRNDPGRAARALWRGDSFLASLSDSNLEALLGMGAARTYERNEVLLNEGAHGTNVLLLISGCVKVEGRTPDGNVTMLTVRRGGDLIGELAALDSGPRSSTVVAASRIVARSVDGPHFRTFLADRQEVAATVHRAIAAKLRASIRHRIDIGGSPSVLAGLARVIEHLADRYGLPTPQGVQIDVPMTQRDLAALVGAAEPSVFRAMSQLRARGAIITGYRRVTVADAAKLRQAYEPDGEGR